MKIIWSYFIFIGYFKPGVGGGGGGDSSDPTEPPLGPPLETSELTWVQTVCKGYQQTTLVGKELKKKNVYDNRGRHDNASKPRPEVVPCFLQSMT